MALKVIVPTIDTRLKNKILQNQNNQCARRPYARLGDCYKNHMCHLWRRREAQGKFENDEYMIVKTDNNPHNSEENLIALCNDCYTVFKNRTEYKQMDRYKEFYAEEGVCDASDNSHVHNLYNNKSQHITYIYINNYHQSSSSVLKYTISHENKHALDIQRVPDPHVYDRYRASTYSHDNQNTAPIYNPYVHDEYRVNTYSL
jgi:sensor c-di-GMP phosphodiesterase-like protein